MKWLKIHRPAPVLNNPKFGEVFGPSELLLDANGHPSAYEFVALPGMQFPITKFTSKWIVESVWLPYATRPIYLDARFGEVTNKEERANSPIPMNREKLLQRMESKLGVPYVWGGNWSRGIPEMMSLYPPTKPLSEKERVLWTLSGVDCSGLLYEAADGRTPRNSTQLVQFGSPVPCGASNIESILLKLEPLDMIVYPGHVLFVRDKESIIESKSPIGVRLYPIRDRLLELLSERKFVVEWNQKLDPRLHFTIRRFAI